MATRRRHEEPKAHDDAAVVDALIRQLRANNRSPAPSLTTTTPAAALPSPGLDARPRQRANTPARPISRARRLAEVWARVGLGVVVALAVPQWPYERACDVDLGVYLLAVATMSVAGVWGAMASWRGRLPAAHVVALCTILWSLVLAAHEVLPRSGYVSAPASWRCVPFHDAPRVLSARPDPAARPPRGRTDDLRLLLAAAGRLQSDGVADDEEDHLAVASALGELQGGGV